MGVQVILVGWNVFWTDFLVKQLLYRYVVEPGVRHYVLVVILGPQSLLGVFLQ